MYSYIKGTLEEISEGQIVIDNHGIGYQVLIPSAMAGDLPAVGNEIKIYTYLHVKEDGVALFGFPAKETLALFLLLLKVNGIGPKGALGILSALSPEDLRFAVLAGDAKAISKAPGIGAKSAQRIILELKDKMDFETGVYESAAEGGGATPRDGAAQNEAVQALVALGYSSSEAVSAIAAANVSKDADTEEVLKAALRQMAII